MHALLRTLAGLLVAGPALAQAEFCAGGQWPLLGTAYGHARLPAQVEDHWTRCHALVPGRAAVALAYPAPGAPVPTAPGEPLAGAVVEVLLVDTASGKALSRQQARHPAGPEGRTVTGLELDLTPLALAPGVTTVGLRVQEAGPLPERPASSDLLTLYALERDTLRRVVDRLPVWTLEGDWDTVCAGTFTETRTTWTLGAGRRKGHADIALRHVEDHRTARRRRGEWTGQRTAAVVRKSTLRYDGHAYVVPPAP